MNRLQQRKEKENGYNKRKYPQCPRVNSPEVVHNYPAEQLTCTLLAVCQRCTQTCAQPQAPQPSRLLSPTRTAAHQQLAMRLCG